jgi:hypothetical protein
VPSTRTSDVGRSARRRFSASRCCSTPRKTVKRNSLAGWCRLLSKCAMYSKPSRNLAVSPGQHQFVVSLRVHLQTPLWRKFRMFSGGDVILPDEPAALQKDRVQGFMFCLMWRYLNRGPIVNQQIRLATYLHQQLLECASLFVAVCIDTRRGTHSGRAFLCCAGYIGMKRRP